MQSLPIVSVTAATRQTNSETTLNEKYARENFSLYTSTESSGCDTRIERKVSFVKKINQAIRNTIIQNKVYSLTSGP